MKRLILAGVIAIGLLGLPIPAFAVECTDFGSWVEKGCRRVVDTYEQGGNELIVSGYSYHLPSTYTQEKRAELNSNAWGGGWGRTVEDPNGDTHMVSAFAFLDSHKRVQWTVAYTYFKYWGAREGLQPGLGYSVFIMQRQDLAGGVPIPAALPQASLRFGKTTLVFTYIPTLNGGVNHGSTLYILGRYALY